MVRQLARVLGLATAAALLILLAFASAVRAEEWEFDRDHTRIIAIWNHLGLSRQQAQFTRAYGKLSFSPENPGRSYLEVTVPVEGLLTGNTVFDSHLKSVDYFDAVRFPYIRFKSEKVVPTGPKSGIVTGQLTIRDVTRQIAIAVNMNYAGQHPLAAVNPVYEGRVVAGFSASFVIKRSDFGIGRGAPLVSDEVTITLDAEFLLRK